MSFAWSDKPNLTYFEEACDREIAGLFPYPVIDPSPAPMLP